MLVDLLMCLCLRKFINSTSSFIYWTLLLYVHIYCQSFRISKRVIPASKQKKRKERMRKRKIGKLPFYMKIQPVRGVDVGKSIGR